jgi:hypothetical protein
VRAGVVAVALVPAAASEQAVVGAWLGVVGVVAAVATPTAEGHTEVELRNLAAAGIPCTPVGAPCSCTAVACNAVACNAVASAAPAERSSPQSCPSL